MGLSIVKKLVALMGGEITIETEKDKGTKFEVRFPNVQIVESYKQEDEPAGGYISNVKFNE